MDTLHQELESRKAEIRSELEDVFTRNMKRTDWDIPEVDDKKAAIMIVDILQEVLEEIKVDITEGKYDFY
jgi:hypothetical protein